MCRHYPSAYWLLLVFFVACFSCGTVQATSWMEATLVIPSIQTVTGSVSPEDPTTPPDELADLKPPILTALAASWWQIDVPVDGGGYLVAAPDAELASCHQASDLQKEWESQGLTTCNLKPGERFVVQTSQSPLWRVSNQNHLLAVSNQQNVTKPGQVIINEVMWPGSYEGATSRHADEWIELYNPTATYLDLSNLELHQAAYFGRVLIFPQVYLPPFAYLVVSSQDQASTQLKNTNLVFSSLLLSNQQANLQLKSSSGQIIDELPSGEWQAGDNNTAQRKRSSAQRRFPNQPGNDWQNWQTCNFAAFTQVSQEKYWKQSGWQSNCGSPGAEELF